MDDRLSEILSPYRGKRDALIPILQKVQAELGYLPDEAMREIARTTGLPESRVFAVASFMPSSGSLLEANILSWYVAEPPAMSGVRKKFWKKWNVH